MAHAHHRNDTTTARIAVLTVSDTRTPEDDTSGGRIRDLAAAAGHTIVDYRIVPDEPAQIRWSAHAALPRVDALIVNGGTGIAPRDVTYEVVAGLLDKEIPGFGELFRSLSFVEIGPAAMLSRALAGVAGDRLVFALPGSTKAVTLAMEKLILPQLGHMVGLLRAGR